MDVLISKINETFLYVDADRSILAELEDHLKFRPPDYTFMPAYRNKMWDGWLRLFSQHDQKLPAGLVNYVLDYCSKNSYSVQVGDGVSIKDTGLINEKQVANMIRDDFAIPATKIETRDYQVRAIKHAINHSRAVLLSPTGSGKSFIQYALVRFYQSILDNDQKLLVIVPTTGLVAQMLGDFADYSSEDENWDAEEECHIIMAGKEKDTKKQIIISTWQSLYKLPKRYFERFGFINIDECHLAEAKSIKKITEGATNCKYRFGTTGTLKDAKTHRLSIEGLLGPVYSVTTTSDLIDKDVLTQIKINCVQLDYTDAEKKALARKDYKTEVDWIESHEKRCRFLANMGDYFAKNTLYLFSRREHGKSLYNELKKSKTIDELYYVDGTIDATTRNKIREACEKPGKVVHVVASYQTFSTGINIKNLHNIVFTSSTKSAIRILQSIGRGLRKHHSKDVCNVYDICDDLRHKSYVNYSMKHAKERELIFIREGFNYAKKKVKL